MSLHGQHIHANIGRDIYQVLRVYCTSLSYLPTAKVDILCAYNIMDLKYDLNVMVATCSCDCIIE